MASAIGGSGQRSHMASLDGLRGVAVLAVMAFHAGHLRGGFLGVDLFFALSGFLITSLLMDEGLRGGRIDLGAFWGRRLRRLMPASLAMIGIVTIVVLEQGSSSQLDAVLRDGPAAQFYVANWHLISSPGGYWASFSEASPFTHMWSLAVEEQFYLVWPLVVGLLVTRTQRPQRWVTVAAVSGIVASMILMVVLLDPADPTRVYMGTDTRASSLLVGALLAVPVVLRRVRSVVEKCSRFVDAGLVVAVVGVAVSWAIIDGTTSTVLFRGGLLLHSCGCALVVAVLAVRQHGAVHRALAWTPLVRVGAISYGLYLWHWPIYRWLAPDPGDSPTVGLSVSRVVLSFVAALLSYRLVEQPVRRSSSWARGWSGVTGYVVSMCVVAALWVAIEPPHGTIAAIDPSSLAAVVAPVVEVDVTDTRVAPPTTDADPAVVTPPADPSPVQASTTTTVPRVRPTVRRVVWMGDSVAHDEAPAIVAALEAAGVEVIDGSAPGFRLGPPDDRSAYDHAVSVLVDSDADLVLTQLSLWDTDFSEAEQQVLLDRLHFTAGAMGAQLFIVGLPPLRADQAKLGAAGYEALARKMADLDPENVTFADASPVWGVEFDDDLDDDGVPERKPDGVHMCPSGAARTAIWLTDELARAYEGIRPTDPLDWVSGEWTSDERYDTPVGACERLG